MTETTLERGARLAGLCRQKCIFTRGAYFAGDNCGWYEKYPALVPYINSVLMERLSHRKGANAVVSANNDGLEVEVWYDGPQKGYLASNADLMIIMRILCDALEGK